jgi:hypothetical protein
MMIGSKGRGAKFSRKSEIGQNSIGSDYRGQKSIVSDLLIHIMHVQSTQVTPPNPRFKGRAEPPCEVGARIDVGIRSFMDMLLARNKVPEIKQLVGDDATPRVGVAPACSSAHTQSRSLPAARFEGTGS